MIDFGSDRLGWCVVVADDDPDWRTLMTHALQGDGYCVVEACDGDELVSCCRSLHDAGEHELIVVSDIDMPARNGIEATVELHALNIDVPVLLITGTQSPGVVDAALKAGARAVLRKPVSGARVVATVNRVRDGNLASCDSSVRSGK